MGTYERLWPNKHQRRGSNPSKIFVKSCRFELVDKLWKATKNVDGLLWLLLNLANAKEEL